MVILQFNKLIRNKWVWGVFAVIVGGAFAFDFLIDDLMRDNRAEVRGNGVGTLAGKPVAGDLFREIAEDVRGVGKSRDWKRANSEVNRAAWETLATLAVADANGITATDAEVRDAIRADRSFQQNGAFSFRLYQYLLRDNGLSPERFEAFLKRRLTQQRVAMEVAEAASWISPMELDRAVADMTDAFTVKIARFTEDKAAADKVTLDAKGLRKWYDDNTNSLALPERVKIRYVRFAANDPKLLAKMTVSEDEMRDQYDATVDKYTSTDTNGVEKVKPFDEVKGEIEKELKLIAAVQSLETNLSFRAYAKAAAKGASRLDEIAKEEGLKVQTSGWFATDGSQPDGFTVRAASVCPGAEGFLDVVAQLDPSSEDLRYGVVLAKDAAWLVERAEVSKAHVPAFSEASEIIRPRALKAARDEAFKASVEAIAKKGAAEVAKTKDVSTNFTFSVSDMAAGMFPNQYLAASAVRKLAKGEVSEFVRTGADTALLVICEDRVGGDAAKATMIRQQARQQLQMLAARELPVEWQKWNLERLGFEPGEEASVTPEETSEEEE